MRVAVALLCLIVIIVGTTADSTKDEKSGISRVMRGVRNGNSAKKKPQEKVGGKRTRKPRRKIKSKGRKVGSKRPGNRRGGKRGGKRSNKNPGRKAAAKKSTKKRGKVSKSKSVKKTNRGNQPRTSGTSRQALKGNDCDYIDLGAITTAGTGCATNGVKFVIKGNSGVRKQFLYVDGKVIIALTKLKFAECTAFTDITSQVNCKAVAGLDVVSLVGTNTPATPGATTSSSSSVAFIIGGVTGDKDNYVTRDQVSTIGSCSPTVNKLLIPRDSQAAAVLDGIVYYCGGYDEATDSQTTQCYKTDSVGNYQWVQTKSMKIPRGGHTMNVVGSKLVAVGGYVSQEDGITASIEIYSPELGSEWDNKWTLATARYDHCTVTISQSEIAVIGGYGTQKLSSVEKVNVDTGGKSSLINIPVAMDALQCEVLSNVIYVIGGRFGDTTTTASAAVYTLDLSNPVKWQTSPNSLKSARFYHQTAVLNGELVAYAGITAVGTTAVYVADYETLTATGWTKTAAISPGIKWFAMVELPCS